MDPSFYPAIIAATLGLSIAGCRTMPPPLRMEPVAQNAVIAAAQARGLVPVTSADSRIAVDLRYATAANAFGRILYPPGFPALLSDSTAHKLAAANAALHSRGLRLLVLDAYRPPEVQWQIFQLFKSEKFVADPRRRWSKHCYGRAVDVTLADLHGRPLPMPSAFDDFTAKASAIYTGSDPEVRENLTLLQDAMTHAGFSIYSDEWWHFNDLSDPAALAGPPIFGRELGLP